MPSEQARTLPLLLAALSGKTITSDRSILNAVAVMP